METGKATEPGNSFRRGRHSADSPGITGAWAPPGTPEAPSQSSMSPVPAAESGATSAQPEVEAAGRLDERAEPPAQTRSEGRSGGHPAARPDVPAGEPAPLANGGEATVFRGMDRDGIPTVIRRSRSGEELLVPAAWDHPHLVSILGAGELPQDLVMELAPGGSVLALAQARGALPIGEAVTLLVPVARALAHLHAAGACHGDVAPQNVLFGADGAPLLADPGMVRSLGQPRARGGTPGFGAPEPERTPASDVYAWGALAWWVLSGSLPGPERHRPPLGMLADGVSPGAARLIEDCLQEDPGLRPPAAELAPELCALHRPQPLDSSAAVPLVSVHHMNTVYPRTRWTQWKETLGEGLARVVSAARAGKARHPSRARGAAERRGSRRPEGSRSGQATSQPRRRVSGRRGSGVVRSVWKRRGWQRAALLGASALALAAGIVAGLGLLPPGGQRPSVSGVVVEEQHTRPAAAVGALPALDRARTRALVERDAGALEAVYATGSPAQESDRATIAALLKSGSRFEGFGSRVASLNGAEAPGGTGDVVVRGQATQAAYRWKGRSFPARVIALEWTMRLQEGNWRIVEVRESSPR